MSDRNTDMDAELVEDRTVKSAMLELLAGEKRCITALKTQLNEVHLVLGKPADDLPRAEADLQAKGVAVEESLSAKRARVRRLECGIATKAERRQQFLTERWELSQTASRELAEDEELLQELQSDVATVTAELKGWHELAAETAKKLNVRQVDVVLQPGLWEDTREDMDAQTVGIAGLQKRLVAKSAEL